MPRLVPETLTSTILSLLFMAGPLSAAEAPRAKTHTREQLRNMVLEAKGIDATRWGEDVRNPFTNLAAEGKARLKEQGVAVDRLVKLKAVLLTGDYSGNHSRTFVNHDSDTILVLGKGFITHDKIYSLGPVLAIEDAVLTRPLTGAGLVWFVEKAYSGNLVRGAPVLVSSQAWPASDEDAKEGARHGVFGWRRPDDFLKPSVLKADAKLPPLAVSDAEKKQKKLKQLILFHEGEDVAEKGEAVVNPFQSLSEEGRAKLAARGIDVSRLRKRKAVVLTGSFGGADSRDFVNHDPDTILIVGKDFDTDGSVFSLGPVLAVANARFNGDVYGADLVWFVDQAFPRGATSGLPVILAPTAEHAQMRAITDDIWHGDYGWRRPRDFLRPAPLAMTRPQLDALWASLDSNDAERSARTMRKLLTHEKHFLPYLKERLRLPPRPAEERVGRLLDDLDSERYLTRQAATQELERLGLVVEPELLFMLETRPSLEMRRRIEQILGGIRAEKRRMRRALQALEEMDPLGSRQLLEELIKGDSEWFVTREAKAILSRKDQRYRK